MLKRTPGNYVMGFAPLVSLLVGVALLVVGGVVYLFLLSSLWVFAPGALILLGGAAGLWWHPGSRESVIGF